MKVSHAVIILLLVVILGVVAYALFNNGNAPSKVVYHNNVARRHPYEWGVRMHPMFSASPTYIVHHNHKNVPHAPAPAPAPEPEPEPEPEAPPSEEPVTEGIKFEMFGNKKKSKKEGIKFEMFNNSLKKLKEGIKFEMFGNKKGCNCNCNKEGIKFEMFGKKKTMQMKL